MKLYNQLDFLNILPEKNTLIIDCGCGDGRVLKSFYENGYKVLGIDKNEECIKELRDQMPEGNFTCDDIRTAILPKGFIIFRNVLQFFDSKEEVSSFIEKNSSNSMYISLFGPEDELKNKALTWTRDEIEKIILKLGDVVWFSETKGLGRNLKNEARYSHTFQIIRLLK